MSRFVIYEVLLLPMREVWLLTSAGCDSWRANFCLGSVLFLPLSPFYCKALLGILFLLSSKFICKPLYISFWDPGFLVLCLFIVPESLFIYMWADSYDHFASFRLLKIHFKKSPLKELVLFFSWSMNWTFHWITKLPSLITWTNRKCCNVSYWNAVVLENVSAWAIFTSATRSIWSWTFAVLRWVLMTCCAFLSDQMIDKNYLKSFISSCVSSSSRVGTQFISSFVITCKDPYLSQITSHSARN